MMQKKHFKPAAAANYTVLPQGYRNVLTLKLKNGRLAVMINALAAAAAVPVLLLGVIIKPMAEANADVVSDKAWLVLIKPLFLLFGIMLYTILREGIHGLLIKYVGGASPTFGFTGLYVYACNDKGFFNKKTHILISILPSAIMVAALLILNIALPSYWFWVIYLIQTINIAGAVGDIYIAYAAHRMPSELLVRDMGVAVRFYTKEKTNVKISQFEAVYAMCRKFRTVYFAKAIKFIKQASVKIWKNTKHMYFATVKIIKAMVKRLKNRVNKSDK